MKIKCASCNGKMKVDSQHNEGQKFRVNLGCKSRKCGYGVTALRASKARCVCSLRKKVERDRESANEKDGE